ncbi:MAG: orotidine-5'-phosphate decarboxylase [Phycisphaerales bacterium]|nr:MAG: orotidine-5'-phosphate decarboxylase [Phycisphaerales bacterium]
MTKAAVFADHLAEALDRSGSPICVGLDPVAERLPAPVREGRSPVDAIEVFCCGVIEAIAGAVGVVKPQSACFERYGPEGVGVLWRVIQRAREAGLLVVLDAKRGDIGLTAGHYAAGIAASGAHAVTANAYLGAGTLTPYLDQGLGVFALVRTSNPEGDAIQGARLDDGRSVAELVASELAEFGRAHTGARGLSAVGAVVGATKAADAAALRAGMPDQVFLVPGFGAQGGKADDLLAMVRPSAKAAFEKGVLVTASRSVIYPEAAGNDWKSAINDAAIAMRSEVNAALEI